MPSLGTRLVIAQFLLIAVVATAGSWRLPLWSWTLAGAGLLLVGWAFLALGRSNFTVFPAPREGNSLVRSGPYRWLRHPMYTAVMICAVAFTAGGFHPLRLLASLLLLGVLVTKVRHEEGLLAARHPGYQEAMRNTWRLFPGVW
jgi:protein-S-isoprenylcysteine O-methyltransferase Ste14